MNKSKTIISLFLSVILVTGTIVLSFSSSFMTANAQGQPSSYYNNGNDNNNYKSKDNINVNINKIKCINDNINVNGVNSGDINAGNKGGKEGNLGAYSSESGKGYYNDKIFDCLVSNKNTNTNTILTGGSGGNDNQTIPPTPEPEPEPEPTTATLTVKKQVFGCTPSGSSVMLCQALKNNSTDWKDCNNDSSINGTFVCLLLPENIFDIEVNASNTQQISQFEGSTEGKTIPNLEPGTYIVNEIKPGGINQLNGDPQLKQQCLGNGFTDGGFLENNTAPGIFYIICFEYKDEQNKDCSTITLAAGEERTCTVKNYIYSAKE